MQHIFFQKHLRFPAALGKLSLIILILFGIGLPIIDTFRFFALLISIVIISYASLSVSSKKILWVLVIILIMGISRIIIPRPLIQEGHNVFILKGEGEAIESGLPKEVFLYIKSLFVERYPPQSHCDQNMPSCWRFYPVPDSLYSFSADAALLKPRYSRVVNSIGFKNLTEFRGGFANDLRYNWYGNSDIKRESMPYFVMYEFTTACIGSLICWKGHALWETGTGHFQPLYHKTEQCRLLTDDTMGKRVFFVSIDNQPQLGFWATLGRRLRMNAELSAEDTGQLSVKFKPSARLRLWNVFSIFTMVLGISVILALVCRPDVKKIALLAFFVVPAIVIVFLYCPHFYGNYYIHEGGEDGLTHQGLGSLILQRGIAGDWVNMLRGEQNVFFDTPGMRYFRALEKLVFGDTNFGYLLLILFLPYILYLFLTQFLSKKWSVWLTVIFLIGVSPFKILENLGLSYYMYVMVARGGWPDTIGYASLFAAAYLGLSYYHSQRGSYLWYGFLAHFLLFIAVFMRPNLFIAASLLALYLSWRFLRLRKFKTVFIASSGFLPVIFPLIHNLSFGKAFYLFTSTVKISLERGMPPYAYVNAFKELLGHNFNGPSIARGIAHIHGLIGPSYRGIFLLILIIVLLSPPGKIPKNLKIIAAVALSLHIANLFFFTTYFRYVLATWALTSIVAVSFLQSVISSRVRGDLKSFDKRHKTL